MRRTDERTFDYSEFGRAAFIDYPSTSHYLVPSLKEPTLAAD